MEEKEDEEGEEEEEEEEEDEPRGRLLEPAGDLLGCL